MSTTQPAIDPVDSDPLAENGVVTQPGIPPGAPPTRESPPVALRQKTAVGFLWIVISTVSNKFVGLVAQLALARLLTREDFGIISLTLAAATFALLLRESGVTQVLVQRGNDFDKWAGPGLGLVSVLSFTSGVLLAVLAHPLAHWYADPRLIPMLYVIALTCPLAGLGNVAVAKLEHDLRFRELGMIATVVTIVQYATQTALALCGLGAMSFVWGIFVSTAARLVWLWTLCRPRAERMFDTRAWRALLADSLWIVGVTVFGSIVSQYDRLLLGKRADLATVGLYFFAFNLTTQTSQMLSNTLGNVLFPALSRLADRPERQREVFIESSRILSCVAMPLCTLQAILARPLVAVFGQQWAAAVPLLQILCVGMAFVVCSAPAVALIQSQGRFRHFFIAQVVFTAFDCLFVTTAAYLFPAHVAIAVATAVALYFVIFGPAGVQLAVNNWKLPWAESVKVYWPGIFLSAVGFAAAIPGWLFFGGGSFRAAAIGWSVSTLCFSIATVSAFRIVYPDVFRQLSGMLASVVRRPAAS